MDKNLKMGQERTKNLKNATYSGQKVRKIGPKKCRTPGCSDHCLFRSQNLGLGINQLPIEQSITLCTFIDQTYHFSTQTDLRTKKNNLTSAVSSEVVDF